MDRRTFCKMGALALGAIGMGYMPTRAKDCGVHQTGAGQLPPMPHGCRVRVLRKECYDDLQALYLDDPDAGACDMYEVGQCRTFAPGELKPAGFCPEMWRVVAQAASAALNGGCARALQRRIQVVSCPSGCRPVVMSVELSD